MNNKKEWSLKSRFYFNFKSIYFLLHFDSSYKSSHFIFRDIPLTLSYKYLLYCCCYWCCMAVQHQATWQLFLKAIYNTLILSHNTVCLCLCKHSYLPVDKKCGNLKLSAPDNVNFFGGNFFSLFVWLFYSFLFKLDHFLKYLLFLSYIFIFKNQIFKGD